MNMIGTFWSLVPPVVAIALALITKEVYSSLFIGIVIGAVFYSVSVGSGFAGFISHLLNNTVGEGDDSVTYGLISCISDTVLSVIHLHPSPKPPSTIGISTPINICLPEVIYTIIA